MLYEPVATYWKKSKVFCFACGQLRNFTLWEGELICFFPCQKKLTAAKLRQKHFHFLLVY